MHKGGKSLDLSVKHILLQIYTQSVCEGGGGGICENWYGTCVFS